MRVIIGFSLRRVGICWEAADTDSIVSHCTCEVHAFYWFGGSDVCFFHFSRKDHTSKEMQMTSDLLLKPLLVSGVRFILGSTSRGRIEFC